MKTSLNLIGMTNITICTQLFEHVLNSTTLQDLIYMYTFMYMQVFIG